MHKNIIKRIVQAMTYSSPGFAIIKKVKECIFIKSQYFYKLQFITSEVKKKEKKIMRSIIFLLKDDWF